VASTQRNLAVAVVARPPVPGRVKTRLAASLGERRACEIYVRLLRETMDSLERLPACKRFLAIALDLNGETTPLGREGGKPLSPDWDGHTSVPTGGSEKESLPTPQGLAAVGLPGGNGDGWTVVPQRGAHLGERLGNLFEDLFARGCEQTVIVNSDSPGLPVEYLETTRRWLSGSNGDSSSEVVFGPTPDGGFYLVAAARPAWLRDGRALRAALADGAMGTSEALGSVVGALHTQGARARLLPFWVDVDDEADLALAGRLLPQTGWAPQGHPRGEPLSELREVFLHVTNRCGTRCPHCYARLKHSTAQELTTDEWLRVVDQAADLGTRSFVFLGGDPFARRDLFELVDHVTGPLERKARIFFNRGLSPEVARRLAAVGRGGLTPLLSLDGPPATNDELRGAGNFATAMRSLDNLVAAGLRPVVNTVALRPVLPGLPELVRIVGGRGVKRLHLILPHQRGGLEEHLEMAPGGRELLAAFEELLSAATEAGVVVDNLVAWKRRLRAAQDFCNAGCKDIAIDPGGLVYACAITCGDPAFVAGDTRDQSLEAIWRHSPAFRLLRAARARDRAACAACDVVDACGGECWMQAHYAARARGRAGGFAAEFPYCGLVRPVLRELSQTAEEAGEVTLLSGQLGGQEVTAHGRQQVAAHGGQRAAGEADLTLFDCI
jgi:radical SAM protein with 4Fe4S-binding SPASM domain